MDGGGLMLYPKSAAALAEDPAFAGTFGRFLNKTATKTADYTAAVRDLVLVDTTSGSVTVTLPTGAAAGDPVGIRRLSAGINTLTVQRGSSDTIAVGTGTATSITLTLQDRTVVLESDGAGSWTPVAGYQSLTSLDAHFQGSLASGQYYHPVSAGSSGTSSTLANGSLRVAPFFVPNSVTLSRIGAEITSAGDAGCKLRLGIYADDGTGYPGALVLDAGTIAGDSVAVQEITISQALSPGLYWIGGAVQLVTVTQPTVRTTGTWTPPVSIRAGTTIPSAGASMIGYVHGSVSGALPSSFTATVAPAGSTPRTLIKVA
jgi:hypothetical protein